MGDLIEFPLDPATKRRVLCDRVVAEATALLARRREDHLDAAMRSCARLRALRFGAASESK
jgi:hypothetical protein